MAISKNNYIVCPNCGNNRSVTDSETGEIICTKCGFVILEKVSEPIRGWHGYTIEPGIRAIPRQITTLARTGMGLSTLIGSLTEMPELDMKQSCSLTLTG